MADYTDRHAPTLRSPSTAKYHALRIGRWLEGKRASETRAVVQAIRRDLMPVYASATINRSLGTLSKALHDAWERGETAGDLSRTVKLLPDHGARKTWLTVEQVGKIADHASHQTKVAIWCSLFTGCRRGEVLQVAQADIGQDVIRIRTETTKTQQYREVPIVAPLRPWLEHLPLSINFEGLKSGFRRAREAAKMPHVQYRDLRRSCGTILLQSGTPMHTVAAILGHSSVKVTEKHYAFLDDGAKAVALNRAFGPTSASHQEDAA